MMIITPPNPQEIFDKIARYCSAEERCKSQVINKLKLLNVPSDMFDGILKGLENAGFLNENRYAELYVRSKVRQNSWGRHKIIQSLRIAGVDNAGIQYGLSQLDEQIYMDALQHVIKKAATTIREKNPALLRKKIIQHALSKGFEMDLINKALNQE